jgi:hypothetical protein
MTVPLRSHASVRSYYFRERLAGIYPSALDHYALSDFRPLWREANCRALTWRRQATNRYNPTTQTWSHPWITP